MVPLLFTLRSSTSLVSAPSPDKLVGETETGCRAPPYHSAGRAVEDTILTTTGDRPPTTDGETPAGVVAADVGALAPDAEPVAASVKPPPNGRRNKGRKRRRKRRRPVYAPGMGPRPDGAVSGPVAPEAVPPVVARESPPAVALVQKNNSPLYAALDLGTNNCRLLVAAPREYGFRVVDAFSRIVRLGEGIGVSGRLAEPAMDRAIEALQVCRAKLAGRDVARARLIATEACRLAVNGADFVDRVRRETGLVLEVVTQETEARLAVAGCASLVDPEARGVILFDIGGGSSELVWIDLASAGNGGRRRRMTDRIRAWMSLPVGVVNASERHGGRHVTPDLFETMVGEVMKMLAGFPEAEALDRAVAAGGVHMLGTSGTVTTLAGVHLELPRYDRRRVDGIWLSGGQVGDLVGSLVAMDYDARVANPCIGRERADLVLAGCAILEAVRRRWPCERLRVADRGLREGVLVELMAEDGVWRNRAGRRAGDPRHG
jgi:exopolyphosphatase/guanosine-5'-triphosphate,3'-diphosphate pyrophosphatase